MCFLLDYFTSLDPFTLLRYVNKYKRENKKQIETYQQKYRGIAKKKTTKYKSNINNKKKHIPMQLLIIISHFQPNCPVILMFIMYITICIKLFKMYLKQVQDKANYADVIMFSVLAPESTSGKNFSHFVSDFGGVTLFAFHSPYLY